MSLDQQTGSLGIPSGRWFLRSDYETSRGTEKRKGTTDGLGGWRLFRFEVLDNHEKGFINRLL